MTLKPEKVTSLYTELGQPPTLGSVPYLTPEPEHITPKGKVLTEYPVGLTFPPDLFPTFQSYATPGIWDLYPEESVPTPYLYLTCPAAKEPLLIPDYYFPPDLMPTFRPYATPGIWNLYPKEKVPTPYPVTLTSPPPGKEPAVGYTYSQSDLVPIFRPYATPGIWNLYPQEKVPTPYPVVVTSPPPGKEPSMQTYKPFPSVLLPTLAAYLTSAVRYTYPPPGKKPTYYGVRFPSDYRSTPEPTNAPTNAPTKKTNIKSTTIPAIITGQGVNGGVCIFAGVSYKQGQQWYDLCSSVCVCEDASTGYYRCKPRCSKNDGVPKGCFMLAPTTLDWLAAHTIIIALSILASVMLISGIALIVQYFRLRKKLPDATMYLPADELKVERNIENYETTDMKQKLNFIDET
ncbi:unnamed protein product [Mytilus coruscus]|uniref:Uncharacterized protein n=1 Tax=Mytilus coruscus TaxID=42192 RepID=A0A6J8BKN3_MYTCO|nr:unnamed protein product [Mytilus coruscus]